MYFVQCTALDEFLNVKFREIMLFISTESEAGVTSNYYASGR